MIDTSKVTNVQFDGIDHRDYPDYCDAYIVSAEIDGREATEEEIQELNEDSDFVYMELMNHIF